MHATDIGLLALRLAVGLTFAAHGAQKSFGWWAGPGPRRWRGAMASMGFTPPGLFAAISMGVELVAGLLLAVGLATPLAAAALVAQSVVIVGRAHWAKGFFNAAGGYEYPLVLGIVAAVVGFLGAGRVSLDEVIGLHPEIKVRAVLLVIGLLAGLVVAFILPMVQARAGGGLRRT
ncbi:MAG TPA: DoxX family protein [Candidatus Limnocylindrales bacterium]|nr:DoxX family protein [Candidatus Limnocylindrales bacterium]